MILFPESHLSWPITYFDYMSIFKPWSNVRFSLTRALIISQWTLRGFTISTPSLVCFVIFWIKTCFLLNSKSFPTTCWKMFWIFFIVCKINGDRQTFGLSYGPRKSLLSWTMLSETRTEAFKLWEFCFGTSCCSFKCDHGTEWTNTKLNGFWETADIIVNSAFLE